MNKLTCEKIQVQVEWLCQEPHHILEFKMTGSIQSPSDLLLISETLAHEVAKCSGHEINIIYMIENVNTKLPLAHQARILRGLPQIGKPGSSYFVGSPALIQTLLRMFIHESLRTNRVERRWYFTHCKEMALSQITASQKETMYFYRPFGTPRLLR